jgi:3',5'-cyclic AMP phosphodiesterase CpdA
MTAFTWLHLSDLHLLGNESTVESGHLDDMLGDIAAQIAKEHLSIDAVFFTGDVTFSGQKEQYDKAISWLDAALNICGLKGRRDRLYIVPGNHDVNRYEVNRAGYTRKFHEELATLANSTKS